MKRALDILKTTWKNMQKKRARILARMAAQCLETRIYENGQVKITSEYYYKSVEAECDEFRIPRPKDIRVSQTIPLCKWYMSWRFSRGNRYTITIGKKMAQCGVLSDISPANVISLIRSWDEANQLSMRQGKESTGIKTRTTTEQQAIITRPVGLTFSEMGKRAYLKEIEETSVLKSRVASMAAVNYVRDDVTEYVLKQFNANNGYTIDKTVLQDGLKDCFNIIWADSVIDSINEKYWGQLRTSLITADESRYHISQKHLNTICHE